MLDANLYGCASKIEALESQADVLRACARKITGYADPSSFGYKGADADAYRWAMVQIQTDLSATAQKLDVIAANIREVALQVAAEAALESEQDFLP